LLDRGPNGLSREKILPLMNRFLSILCLTVIFVLPLVCPAPTRAAVEIAWEGRAPQRIEEVYLHQGIPYLPAAEVFPALGLRGHWDSVAHLYRLKLPAGKARFFPGGRYFYYQGEAYPLEEPARFIDQRLRLPESLVTGLLPQLLRRELYYRNLDPPRSLPETEEGGLERLFALLMRKETPSDTVTGLHGVFIDPGHGGGDPGVIGPQGEKEKDVTLALALQLKKQIRMRIGIPVFLSRDADYGLEQKSRFSAAADAGADVYLSIHAQSSANPQQQGLLIYVRPEKSALPRDNPSGDASWQLATALQTALADQGWPMLGVRSAPLLPLGHGDLPAVLIEAGFLSNQEDRQALFDKAEQVRLTTALRAGLESYSEILKEKQL